MALTKHDLDQIGKLIDTKFDQLFKRELDKLFQRLLPFLVDNSTVVELRGDVSNLKTEISEVRSDVNLLKDDVARINRTLEVIPLIQHDLYQVSEDVKSLNARMPKMLC